MAVLTLSFVLEAPRHIIQEKYRDNLIQESYASEISLNAGAIKNEPTELILTLLIFFLVDTIQSLRQRPSARSDCSRFPSSVDTFSTLLTTAYNQESWGCGKQLRVVPAFGLNRTLEIYFFFWQDFKFENHKNVCSLLRQSLASKEQLVSSGKLQYWNERPSLSLSLLVI